MIKYQSRVTDGNHALIGLFAICPVFVKQTLEPPIGQSGDTVRASYEGALLEREEAEYAALVATSVRRLSGARASRK